MKSLFEQWNVKYSPAGVKVKKSGLAGAGLGLFARKPFRKGDLIVEYAGRHRPWKDIKGEELYNRYLLRLDRTSAVDASRHKKYPGRYANDANGSSKKKGLRNNSEYMTYGKRCYIEATRNIRRGEEILVNYGREYWKMMRKKNGE